MFKFCLNSTFVLVALFSAGQLSAQADIWMKDCNADVGNEPNNECPLTNHCASTGCSTSIMWRSVDIWNRVTPDTNHDPSLIFLHSSPPTTLPHQNPVYRPLIDAQPNYLYIRVRNRGNQPTTGTERLRMYWSKAGTGLDWPADWVDNMDTVCGPNKLYGIEITKPRKSAAHATPAERDAFIAAIHAIDTDSLYSYATTNADPVGPGVSWWDIQDMMHEHAVGFFSEHNVPGFLPWHREFIHRYELALRTANPLVRCLYWDPTDDPQPRHMDGIPGTGNAGTFNLLNDNFMGGDAGSLGNAVEIGVPGGNNFNDLYHGAGGTAGVDWRSSGPGGGNHAGCDVDSCYLLPPQFIERGTRHNDFSGPDLTNGSNGLLDGASFNAHWSTNEGQLHGSLHGYSSGNQCCVPTTSEDPMFFTGIHLPVDKMWAMWQRDRTHLSNPDRSRINPDTAYGTSSTHNTIVDDLHPWDGKVSGTLAAANVYPWDTKPVYKTATHPAVVYPPIYDDAPLTIPPLGPGECIIIEIPWYPPNPADYDCSALQNPKGHVCVLARIEEDENAPFGMTTPEVQSVYQNTKNNNNIAWKNMDVVTPSGITGVTLSEIILANPLPFAQPFRFELDPVAHLDLDDDEGRRFNIFNFGRVKLHLGDELFARWEEGGRIGMGGGEPRTVFEDDFNRANGVLDNWTPRSDRWQVVRGELAGSGIVNANFNEEPFTFAPFELPESFELEFDLRFTTTPDGTGRHGGVMFCAQENNLPRIASTSYTLDWIDNEPNTRVRGLRLTKNRVDANGRHREARLGVNQQRNPPGHWKIVVNPEGIVVYGDGEEMGRSEDSGYRGGYLGFWTYGNGTRIAVDNLQVRTLGGGETMVAVERQGVLALDCPTRYCTPAVGINLDGNETRMIAVEFELDENYLEQGRNFLATRPLEYHLIQTGANGEAIGGQTYVVDLSKLKLVPEGSDWRYISRRSAPRNWTQVDYNDDDWESGPADLGYGDKQKTFIGVPPDPKISTVQSYFRHRFDLSQGDINAISNLWLRLKVDDGAEVYLNGRLIHRRNMAEEGQRPLRPVEGLEEDTYFPVDITRHRDLLIANNTNVLAVSVHNHPEGDNDLTFNLELLANHLNEDEPTVIAIQEPKDGAYFEVGDTIPISAEAIDPDGEENPRISYEVNGQPIRLIDGARPSFTPRTPGVYKLRAGCSNNPATHTVTFCVIANLNPKVELTLPGGHMFDEGEPIILRAEVEDTDDVSVRFTALLMNDLFALQADLPDDWEPADGFGIQLGVDDRAPYEAMVDDLSPGHWAFFAIALDARGGVTTTRMGMANVMATQAPPPDGWQVPGDFTQNGTVDIADSIAMLRWLFGSNPGPACPAGAEFNGDGVHDISDAVAGLSWLFVGGGSHHLGTQCQIILTCADVCTP